VSRTEQRLHSRGLTKPPAKAPVANYLGYPHEQPAIEEVA